MATLEQMEEWRRAQELGAAHSPAHGGPVVPTAPQMPQAPAAQPQEQDQWASLVASAPELLGSQPTPTEPEAKGAQPASVPMGTRAIGALSALFGNQWHNADAWNKEYERIQQAPIEQQKRDQQARSTQLAQQRAGQQVDEGRESAGMRARMRDPNSEESRRAQEVLRQMGVAGADNATAEDFQRLFPGYANVVAGDRQEAAQRHAMDAAEQRRKMQLEDEQRRADRGRDEFLWRHPYMLERAEASAAARGEIQRELTTLRDELGDQDRLDRIKEQAERPLTRPEFDSKVEAFGQKLQSSGVPAMAANLRELQDAIEEARQENDGRIFSAKDDIIRRAGPDGAIGLMSPSARRVMQTWQKVMNAQIKDEAGAAVAKQEMERQKVAFGKGLFWGEDDFVRGIDGLARAAQAAKENYAAAYGPEIVGEYQRRLEQVRGGQQQPSAQPQQAERVRVRLPDGSTGTVDADKLYLLPAGSERLDGP